MTAPGLSRRLGSVLYDGLTLIALWLLASAMFTSLYGMAESGAARLLLQSVALTLIAGYFLWCWTHGGQTLAMRAWRLRVVHADGASLTPLGALLRLLLAGAGVIAGGVTFWWALLDREGLFLHDRLARTKLVMAPPDQPS